MVRQRITSEQILSRKVEGRTPETEPTTPEETQTLPDQPCPTLRKNSVLFSMFIMERSSEAEGSR